jgi:monoamine oxidase
MPMTALPAVLDVAVIGAGASGVAAARRLAGSGLSVGVLEARDRIGGRALTVEREGVPLDVGCGWLHSADENPMAALAEANGFTLDKTPPPWESQAFNLEMTAAEQDQFRRAFADFEERVAQAASTGDDGPASTLFDPDCPWNGRMDAISGALNGARFAEVAIGDYDNYRDTEVNWRVAEGYGRLVERLASGLPVTGGCAVERIDRSGPTLRLETSLGVVEARAVIVTVSTTLLAEERVRFDPPLPDLVEAADGLRLGLASKLHLAVEGWEAFPKDGQLWGRNDTAATAGYHLRPFGRPIIEAYFGGDLAWGLEAEGEGAFLAFAEDELVSLLGSEMRKRIRPLSTSMWGVDPFSRGAYSHARPGRTKDRRALRTAVEDRIFIAGEATSIGFYGTVHGAWIEGERAAEEALRALA